MRNKVRFLAADCARARESVSVQLDGELPELDLDRLETHLRICPACTAWAAQVRDVTQRLRDAPLEVPVASHRVARHGRWLLGMRSPAVAATLAVASVAGILALHPARLAPSSNQAALGRGSVRLLPQQRLVRLDGGFVFGVRTIPEGGRLLPS
jgi:anti-sigma factor RsiW